MILSPDQPCCCFLGALPSRKGSAWWLHLQPPTCQDLRTHLQFYQDPCEDIISGSLIRYAHPLREFTAMGRVSRGDEGEKSFALYIE